MENSMEASQKKKKERKLPCDPAIPLLHIYLKKTKTLVQKEACTSVFKAALFTIANIWKQPKRTLTEEWIKMWCIYTMEYYSAIKRMKFCH